MTRKHAVLPLQANIRSGGADSILAKMIRVVMHDLGIDCEERYQSLMSRYVRRQESLGAPAAKLGLQAELMRESISWKTFMRGMDFLHVGEFELAVEIQHPDGTVSRHGVTSGITSEKEAGIVLANLLAKTMLDLAITRERYEACMEKYLSRFRTTTSMREKSALRAGIAKDLLKSNLTWKNFVKGLQFIGAVRFTVVLTLTHRVRKTVTVHRVDVDIGEVVKEEEDGSD